jgi:hypothetical protein
MKRLLFSALLGLALTISSQSQIVREAAYSDIVNIVTLSDQSKKYIIKSGDFKYKIYSTSHVLEKELVIDTASLNIPVNATALAISNTFYNFSTDKLVDNDNGIEIIVKISFQVFPPNPGPFTPPTYHNELCIFNDDGTVLFEQENQAPITDFIFKTEQGTKMFVDSICYSLSGSLPSSSGSGVPDLLLSNDTLSIKGGNYVLLKEYRNSEEQKISLVNDSLKLTNSPSVFLGKYLDSKTQELSLSNDTLKLTNGSKVFLGMFLDNQNQTMSISGDSLKLTNSPSVYLGNYRPKESQTLALSNDTLKITQGNSIYLGKYLQQLAISNDTLYLTNGGKVYIGSKNTGFSEKKSATNMGLSNCYPNPTNSILNFEYNIATTEKQPFIGLFGTDGKLIALNTISASNSQGSIDLKNFPAGTYYLKLLSEKGSSASMKIIKVD